MERLLAAAFGAFALAAPGFAAPPDPPVPHETPRIRELAFGPARVVAPDPQVAREDARQLAESAGDYLCARDERRQVSVEVHATETSGEFLAAGRVSCLRPSPQASAPRP